MTMGCGLDCADAPKNDKLTLLSVIARHPSQVDALQHQELQRLRAPPVPPPPPPHVGRVYMVLDSGENLHKMHQVLDTLTAPSVPMEVGSV
jgi:hypothetical protein